MGESGPRQKKMAELSYKVVVERGSKIVARERAANVIPMAWRFCSSVSFNLDVHDCTRLVRSLEDNNFIENTIQRGDRQRW